MSETSKRIEIGKISRLALDKERGQAENAISDLELKGFLQYLNVGKSRERERVIGILQQILVLAGVEPSTLDSHSKRRPPSEIRDIANALNGQLARYRFTPRVYYSASEKLAIAWDRDWRKQYRPRMTGAQVYESQAIDWILDLTRAGRIHLLRRCSQCKEWFYARSRNQKFCSVKCQQRDYTQSESWKAHRRDYMRKYYKENFPKRAKD